MSDTQLNKIKKQLAKYSSHNLSEKTKRLISARKLKIGDKVKIKEPSRAFYKNINKLFESHTVGGVIKDATALKSAIQYYMLGQGMYKYAKIVEFNNDASGGHTPIPGVKLLFVFADKSELTSWYYIKDVVKMK